MSEQVDRTQRTLRPCWLGWFRFGQTDAPGNCRVDVVQGRAWLNVSDLSGQWIARYVSAPEDSDLAQLSAAIRNARVDNSGLPIVAYWTLQAQGVGMPDAEIVGVEAYRKAHESLALFERRVATALDRVAATGRRAMLIGQAYSSNATNHTDLRSVVAVYARLAAVHPHVVGILAFSAGPGRASGWEDHPEIHADWRTLFAGIPSAPVLADPPAPPPIAPPRHEEPHVPSFRRLPMETIVGLRPGGLFISSEPGKTGIEFRDISAPAAWEELRMVELPSKHVRFEFVASGLTLSVNAAGGLETRPAGTDGPWETFIAGIAPSGERVAFRQGLVGPVFEVVEVTA